MYNQNPNHNKAPPMSPRISFSNDFVETSHSHTSSHSHSQMRSNVYRDAPVSSDFEFSVSNYNNSMTMSADELFFKGRLLPLKEGGSCSSQKVTTLRDELQNDEEDEDGNNGNSNGDFSLRPPKNPARWRRGFLGLRKSHIGSKKSDKGERSLEKRSGGDYHHDVDVQCSNKNSQEFVD